MKSLPTVLILAAFGILLYISSKKPSPPPQPLAGQAAAAQSGSPSSSASAAEPVSAAPRPTTARSTPAAKAPPPPGTVSGRALGPGEIGIPARILLQDGRGNLVAETIADSTGAFALQGVKAGSYRVTAEDPNLLYTVAETQAVEVPVNGSAAVNVGLGRGTATITGRVTGGQGEVLPGEKVLLQQGDYQLSVNTNADGEFRLGGLPAGTWKALVAQAPSRGEEVKLEAGGMASVSLRLVRTAHLTLTLSATKLNPYHFSKDDTVRIIPVDSSLGSARSARVTVPDSSDGAHGARATVRFTDLPPGAYRVEVSDRDGKSLLLPDEKITYQLHEGEDLAWGIAVKGSGRGQGIEISMVLKVVLVISFAILMGLPLVLFPPPLTPRRPPQAAIP